MEMIFNTSVIYFRFCALKASSSSSNRILLYIWKGSGRKQKKETPLIIWATNPVSFELQARAKLYNSLCPFNFSLYFLLRTRKISGITTGIRGFSECRPLCWVPFIGHSAKQVLPRTALGKVRLSATSLFTECWTLGTGPHSAKTRLPSVKHYTRQRWRSAMGRPKADDRQSLSSAEDWTLGNLL
jgi:hypothetical protein